MNTNNQMDNQANEHLNNVSGLENQENVLKKGLHTSLMDYMDSLKKIDNPQKVLEDLKKVIEKNDFDKNDNGVVSSIYSKFLSILKDKQILENDKKDFFDKNLRENLVLEGQKFLSKQENLQDEIRKKFKSYFKEITDPNDRKLFEDKLKTLSFEKLEQATYSIKNMKKIFEEAGLDSDFFVLDDAKIKDTLTKFQFDFQKYDNLSDDEKNIFNSEMKNFFETGKISKETLDFIIEFIPQTSRVEIIKFFVPMIDFYDLEQMKILDDAEILKIKEKFFDEFLKGLNQAIIPHNSPFSLNNPDRHNTDDFLYFKNNFNLLNIKIPTNDIDNLNLEKLFVNDKLQDKFATILQKQISEITDFEANEKIFKGLDEFIESFFEKIEDIDVKLFDKINTGSLKNEFKQNFVEGGFFEIKSNFTNGVWRIEKLDAGADNEKGIVVKKMTLRENDGKMFWGTNPKDDSSYFYSYKELVDLFIDKLTNKDIHSMNFSKNEPEAPELSDVLKMDTLEDFKKIIDEMDPNNSEVELEDGMSFSVMVGKKAEVGTINNINELDKTIELKMFDGKIHSFSWEEFIEILDTQSCYIRRIGKINSQEDFAKNAKTTIPGEYGSNELQEIEGLHYDNSAGCVAVTEADENGKEISSKVSAFKHKDEAKYFEVDFSGAGVKVKFIEYGSIRGDNDAIRSLGLKTDEDLNGKSDQYKNAYKAERDRTRKKIMDYGTVSYSRFLQLMQETGINIPLSEKAINKELTNKEEDIAFQEGNHIKNSSKKGITLKWTNVKTVWEVFEGNFKYWSEYFEHIQDARESYAFLGMGGHLGRVGVTKMSKLIDSTMTDIKSKYSGKDRRYYIAKTVLEDGADPKPHEVLACAMLTLEMAGHFYPDTSLSDKQDREYKWFPKICEAIGVDPRVEYKRCYDKISTEKPDSAHRLSEEDLVERLFKFHQDNPYIQALGGGAKFWNMAPSTRNSQAEKGAKEVGYNSTEIGRAEYVLSKMNSNEFEVALGAIPSMFAKGTSPEALGVAFVIAAGNAPNYVHNETLDKIKNIAYEGVPFHGFWFLRNKKSSDLYKDIIKIALREYDRKNGTKILEEYEKINNKFLATPYQHKDDQYKDLWKFWRKNHTILHPILQGVDPTLQITMMNEKTPISEKEKIRSYFSDMSGQTQYFMDQGMMKKFKIDTNANGTFMADSFHFFYGARTKERSKEFGFKSLTFQLSAIDFDKVAKTMGGPDRDAIFSKQILDFLKFIRTNKVYRENPEYMKEQFKISFLEILEKFVEKTFPIKEDRFYESLDSESFKHFKMLVPFFGEDVLDYKYLKEKKFNSEEFIEKAFKYFVGNGSTGIQKVASIKSYVEKNVNMSLSANDEDHKIPTNKTLD